MVRAFDDGHGPGIVVVPPGMDDGSGWGPCAKLLATRFRVLRLQRRQYRLDLTHDGAWSIADEAEDVCALARVLGDRVLLVGHSSGGIVALEAALSCPSAFAGLVLYEPPVRIGPPLGGDALVRARVEVAGGRNGRALAIHLRDVVRAPLWLACLAPLLARVPAVRPMIPRQLDDLEAIDQLGFRLDAYRGLAVPTVLLGGDRSPTHLADRLDGLARVLQQNERVVMRGRGHDAHRLAPAELAQIIERAADRVFA